MKDSLWNGKIPFIVDGVNIAILADSLIPFNIYFMGYNNIIDYYSPQQYIYLAAFSRLQEDGEQFNQMVKAQKFWMDGKTMAPWKVNIKTQSFTGKFLTQKMLKALYEYYVTPVLNRKGTRAYNFSNVVTTMKRRWVLQGEKYI